MSHMQLDWSVVGDSLQHLSTGGFNGSLLPSARGRPRRATDSNLVVLEPRASRHGSRAAAAAASSSLRPPRVWPTTVCRPAKQDADCSIGESVAEGWPAITSSERPAGARYVREGWVFGLTSSERPAGARCARERWVFGLTLPRISQVFFRSMACRDELDT